MGRSPCCDKVGLKKGPWTPEEDEKLLAYIEEHGHGNWRALPSKAGLQRCGKSCRLRWTNYLRPDIKRGKFSLQEEQTIIQLHAFLGNRWSAIATHLPKRTDNEIKNYWNTHLKKRLAKMGIDPVTHKPKNDALLSNDGQSKNAANLSHMAQWESARLEAEARLARQSKLRSHSLFQTQLDSPGVPFQASSCSSPPPLPPQVTSTTTASGTRCLDVLKAWQQGAPWPKKTSIEGSDEARHSPTSTLSSAIGGDESSAIIIEFMGSNSSAAEQEGGLVKEEGSGEEGWKQYGNNNNSSNHSSHLHYNDGMENSLSFTSELPDQNSNCHQVGNFIEGFTELLLSNLSDKNFSDSTVGGSDGGGCESGGPGGGSSGAQCCEDNKSYWNSILNLVNYSPSSSPLF